MSEKKQNQYPEPVVGALIINKDGKFLFAKGQKWSGKYTVPGGHVEMGENLEEATKREVREEAGIEVEWVAQLGFGESVFSKEDNKERHFIFLDGLCRYDGEDNEVKMNDEFAEDYVWVTPEEALKLDLAHGGKHIINKYLEYKKAIEALDGWKRCLADFENFRKQQEVRQVEFRKFAAADLISQILPILDNFHASTDHIPDDQKENPWVVGIMHIQKQLEGVLNDNGVEEIMTKVGDQFDHNIHEAVANQDGQETNGKKDKNKIIKIVSRGYKIDGKVIRPARVVVD